MKYKLLIFDWDGTLANTHPAVVGCMQQTANDLQLPVPEVEHISISYGLPLKDMICRLFPTAECEVFLKKFQQYCLNHDNRDCLFDDAAKTLQHLQKNNYLMAIATNKIRKELLYSLDHLDLHDCFCAIRCGDDGFVKPQPEVLHGILDELSIKPQNAVMIGDSKYDMLAAQNAKVDAIAVCYEPKQQQNYCNINRSFVSKVLVNYLTICDYLNKVIILQLDCWMMIFEE